MKKYITTDKHPELKEGIELKKSISDNFVYCHIGAIEHGFNAEEEWVKKGWIREIQEPKWTDDDMIKFHLFLVNRYDNDLSVNTYEELFKEYKQSKS